MAGPTLLLINKFYHDTGRAGGVGRYVVQEQAELERRGWTVVPFAIREPESRPTPWARFFPPAHDYAAPGWSPRHLAAAVNLLWNRTAARNLSRLLREVRPDVVHLHNIYHHLSPSLLPVLRRHRLPAVMTLHDLRLLCPAIHMLRQGEVCERCRGGRFLEAVRGKCVKGSRAASLLAAVETAHQWRRRLYPKAVTRFLCPSAFYADKYAEWGYPREKLVHLPNFVDTDAWRPATEPPGDYYLYFGRLSAEKGLRDLLAAHARWEAADADALELRIAGSGPLAAELADRARALGLRRCRLLGPVPPAALAPLVARARFTVLPSRWYENGPLALLESLAAGVPVAGADIGGIPEHLDDGADGVLFRPGDPADLHRALQAAAALPPAARAAARRKAETRYAVTVHLDALERHLREVAGAAPGNAGSG